MQYDKQARDETVQEVLILFWAFILLGIGSAVAFLCFHSNGWGAGLAFCSGGAFLACIVTCVAARDML